MKNKEIDVKKYILLAMFVCVLIIIIMISTIIIKNKKSNKEDELEGTEQEDISEIGENEFETVKDVGDFFKIENCIQTYYEILAIKDLEEEEEYIPGMEESTETVEGITSEGDKKQAIIDILSKDYIKDNNISKENIYDYVQEMDLDKYKIQAIKEQVYKNDNVRNYYVEAQVIEKEDYKVIKNIYFVVNTTINDDYFSIYPLEEESNNLNSLINNEEIVESDNNILTATALTDAEIIVRYFSDFKMNALNKTDYAFQHLDEEYRKKRFGDSKEDFDKYIDKNYDEISQIVLKKYSFQSEGDNRTYIGKDKYENIYTIEATGAMQYTIKLDTYTIESDSYKNTYQSTSDEGKISMNIDKWFAMLNSRDYKAAYGVLDETFRNENFGSEENFESYMRELYPLHYTTEKGDINKESNAYVQDIVIKDITGENDSEYENNIIMQLKEGTNFVMSFYIRRK